MSLRWVLAVFFAAAGYAHLTAATLLAITPGCVPFAPHVIFVTGLFEFAAPTALLTERWRAYAGIALSASGRPISSTPSSTPSTVSIFPTCPRAGGIMGQGWRCSR
jgi:hypothetical protein